MTKVVNVTETKQDDVSKLANYCRVKLDLSDIQMPDEYGYSSLPLCIIDAVFSVGVTYTSTRNTVNRFKSYYPNYADLSIQDFVDINRENSIEWLAKNVYQNRQRTSTRSGILKSEAVLRVAEVLLKHNINYLQDMDAIVNNPEFEADFKKITGQGSGISLRYFYMLIGIKTEIKPDRMILRFIKNALGHNIKVKECHPLLVSICEVLKTEYPDLTPRSLDHAIWLYQKSQ